jgi:hypothetical protein
VTRMVLYVAHPVAPTDEQVLAGLPEEADDIGLPKWSEMYPGDVARHRASAIQANLASAMKWLSWLRRSFPETTFIAPWIADIQGGADDSDPAQRERGFVDCCAVVERCDGIVLVGPRISSGMARERDHGLARAMPEDSTDYFEVYDLTANWESPPGHPYSPEFDDFPWSQSNPRLFDQIQRIQGLGKG